MSEKHFVTIDANTAAAHVAYAASEVIAIYPITPSSPMGEISDEQSAAHEPNLWGTVPTVIEMQSEGGAAGAVHGALTTGSLATTFTASQGLLLMIPNMYKIAGELTPMVMHVAARAIATHALSIFGDHSDVMAARSTGFAMLSSANVQEAMDMALITHAATLEARVPFIHFFDGFRTSHEIQKIEELSFDDMRAMIDETLVAAHRARGLSPDRPVMRGTAQNPDVYFQGREAVNKYYLETSGIVQNTMDRLATLIGRQYHLFDYYGAPDAEHVVVVMGSGGETLREVADYLMAEGRKVGVLQVRLYRPFASKVFVTTLPKSVQKITVLDRTKEPGATGEPLYLDVCTALTEAYSEGYIHTMPVILGGRYGLGSKEFNSGMAKAVFDNMLLPTSKNHFTAGINDDVTRSSLDWDTTFSSEPADVRSAIFYGLGSDGTVGANKNTIKIIGKATDYYAQGYFVYDSKKSGSMTTSHLRFSKQPIRSIYLIQQADFLACHQFSFLERFEMLSKLKYGGTFLLNSPYPADEVWTHLPLEVQEALIEKEAQFYIIDALKLAKTLGLKGRINTTMQAAYFAISGVLPEEEALKMIKLAIEDTYGDKGQKVVDMNIRATEMARQNIQQVAIPSKVHGDAHIQSAVAANAPDFVRNVTAEIIAGRGDELPVSAMPVGGTYPVGTARYEKRNIADEIPVWQPESCIQCNQCVFVCPHAAIRVKVYDSAYASNGSHPADFKSMDAKGKQFAEMSYTLQVAPEDCTGCGLCVQACPAFEKVDGVKTERRAINMAPQPPLRAKEADNFAYFQTIPDTNPALFSRFSVKGSQFLPTMFEFSGACAGCGETPYIKLVTQLFGDRSVIANATGCSSIYGGNLPTTPYTTRADGRGPAWSNSLFEDNAEFGMGMRLTIDKFTGYAHELLDKAIIEFPEYAVFLKAIKDAHLDTQEDIEKQREYIDQLKSILNAYDTDTTRRLMTVADYLVKKTVWIIGGDGWAYDIGYGGLDHALNSGLNINILVLDTGVYSNTGFQASKATPRAAVAKFASAGKAQRKKDLGLMAISYGGVYVAQIALGADMTQTVKAMQEAEAYPGPSLVIAYGTCIAHGIEMNQGLDIQKEAVQTGFWPLYRYNPASAKGKPFQLDSDMQIQGLEHFMTRQGRFNVLTKSDPQRAQQLLDLSYQDVLARWEQYQQLAEMKA